MEMTRKQFGLFIGARVKAFALAKSPPLTQVGLARASGINQTSIFELWTGDSPQVTVRTLDAVATALETTIDELLGKGRE